MGLGKRSKIIVFYSCDMEPLMCPFQTSTETVKVMIKVSEGQTKAHWAEPQTS